MVTWGQNTVHTFGTPAPAPASTAFGSPSPAPTGGGLFGAPAPAPPTSTGLFGTPAPAPAGSSLFGVPAPAPSGGGLFGTPAPAPGGGLFGSTPAQAPFGGFGSTAPAPTSIFGGSTAAPFGAPAPAPNALGQTAAAQPAIPAQAALQAHMDASARQEAERVRSALESLHAAYTGSALPNSDKESKFVAIVYNDMTREQRQLQWVHGMGSGGAGGQLLAPPKPPQVSDAEWNKAVVNNPDPENYMPVALVGAVALQGRVSWQQNRAKELSENASTLQRSHDTLKERCTRVSQDLEQLNRRHAALRKRLIDVMRRVELARCMNLQIQPDELKAIGRLMTLHNQVDAARSVLLPLQDKARTLNSSTVATEITQIPDKAQLLSALKQHREAIEKLTMTAKQDLRDVGLIQQRLASSARA